MAKKLGDTCTMPPNFVSLALMSGRNQNGNKIKRKGTKGAFGKSKLISKQHEQRR
jgi:hypothetical protein